MSIKLWTIRILLLFACTNYANAQVNSADGTFNDTHATAPLSLRTNGTTRLTIVNSGATAGNVGIGTTTPQTKLQVMETTLGLTPNGSTINSGFMISGNSTGGSLNMGIDGNGTYSTTFYSWIQSRNRDNNAMYNLALNPIGGNVGIGTASPLTKLQIMDISTGGAPTSTIPNQGLLISGNSTGGSLNMGIDATGSFYSWIQSRNRDNNSTYPLALNPSGGSVGIGTSSPQAKLHIFGGKGFFEHDTEASILYKATTFGQYWDVGANNVGYYIYENNSQTYSLVINKNGNVGIGTNDPASFKLAVNGKIWAKEVQVALNIPGPDYVFEETYNLPSLADTENYIKQNKHLPEVPSACEMEEKGINLSEMNMILLKKVEELTLHLLKQEKTIAEQNQRLLKLENKE